MSAQVLRDGVRNDIQKEIDDVRIQLSERFGDTDQELRVKQGIVEGLKRALGFLNNRYKDMNG